MHKTALVALVMATLVACGGGSGQPAAEPSTTLSATPSTTGSETTMPTSDQDQLASVGSAVGDLAERLGAPPTEIEVVSAEKVTWPDGSLGCPEPGMSYTQSLVDGSKVVLRYDERVYVYHAGSDDQPFLCPSEDKDGGHEMVPPPGYNS